MWKWRCSKTNFTMWTGIRGSLGSPLGPPGDPPRTPRGAPIYKQICITDWYCEMILRNYISELYCGIVLRNYIPDLYYGIMLGNDTTEIYWRMILRNYMTELHHNHIMKSYCGIILRHKDVNISTNLQRQQLSIGASESFRCHASTQRPPSKPRALPDSPGDLPGVYPGNLPGYFIMRTWETVHNLEGGCHHVGRRGPVRPLVQDPMYVWDIQREREVCSDPCHSHPAKQAWSGSRMETRWARSTKGIPP